MEILLSCRELPTWSRILNSAILRLYLVFQLKISKLENPLTLIISVCDPVMGDNGHYVYLKTPNFNSPKILSTVLPIWCRFTEIRSCRLQTCSRRTLSNWGTCQRLTPPCCNWRLQKLTSSEFCRELTGMQVDTEESCLQAVNKIHALGVRTVVVTSGIEKAQKEGHLNCYTSIRGT